MIKPEPFTIIQLNTKEVWTRNTKNGAIGLADNIARTRKQPAQVSYSGDGKVIHVSDPSKFN